jgi:predicted GNAT family acetyltransferase
VVSVTEMQPSDVALVDRVLPLSRLDRQVDERSTYLVAREDDHPVGHAHIAWGGTHLGLPEIQDVFVLPERRRRGLATRLTEAAEAKARERGWESISLSVSRDGNAPARLPTKRWVMSMPAPTPCASPERSCCVASPSRSTTRSCTSRSPSDAEPPRPSSRTDSVLLNCGGREPSRAE